MPVKPPVSVSSKSPPLAIEVYTSFETLPSGAWDDLWHRDVQAHVYQSSAWLKAWERHYQPDQLELITLSAENRLVAALPLFLTDRWREGQFRGRLRTIASSCSPAYPLDMAPLIDPEFEGSALEALARYLTRLGGADALVFELYAAGSRSEALLTCVAAQLGCQVLTQFSADSHLVDLAPTYDLFLESLGARTRRNVRAYAKKFYEAGPHHQVVAAESPADFTRLLTAMAEQKAKRFAELGRESNLDEQRLTGFLNEALPALHRAGLITGLMAMVGERIGATQLYLHDPHGHAYSYNSSFDMEFKELRLHYILETERFKRAIESGYSQMDLSTGHAEHKQHWTNGRKRALFEGAVLLRTRGRLIQWACDRARAWKARRTAPETSENESPASPPDAAA